MVVHIFAGEGHKMYGPPTFGYFFDTFPYKNFQLAIFIACFIARMAIISVNKDKMKLNIADLGLTTAKHHLVCWYFLAVCQARLQARGSHKKYHKLD